MRRSVVFALVALLPVAAAHSDELQSVRKALLAKKYDLAEVLAREAVPKIGAQARYLLAVAEKGLRKYDAAALDFAKVARTPDIDGRLRSRALYGHALAQMARRDWQAAINVWSMYLEFARVSPADAKFTAIAERELKRCRTALAASGPAQ
jgi:hypothetical protein